MGRVRRPERKGVGGGTPFACPAPAQGVCLAGGFRPSDRGRRRRRGPGFVRPLPTLSAARHRFCSMAAVCAVRTSRPCGLHARILKFQPLMETESTIRLYSLDYGRAKTYAAAGLCVAANVVVPQLCHLVPGGGAVLLPIYFFTLVAAVKYGWRAGLLTAVASPRWSMRCCSACRVWRRCPDPREVGGACARRRICRAASAQRLDPDAGGRGAGLSVRGHAVRVGLHRIVPCRRAGISAWASPACCCKSRAVGPCFVIF